jgi:small subunit ribosomal protein S6
MKQYETMVIVDAMISEEAIRQELGVIRGKIEATGNIVRVDDWGKRKMAYSIKKKSHGHYCVFYYEAETSVVETLEKDFRINENILRWLTLADHPMTEYAYGDLPDDGEDASEKGDDSDSDEEDED